MPHNKQFPTKTDPSLDGLSWIMLITLSIIWGGSFLFGRIAVLEISPLITVFFRVFLAAIALWIFILFTNKKIAAPKSFITSIFVMALLNNVIPFSFILYGQKEIGSGLASIINAMTPIWTVLIANKFTQDEKLSSKKLIGIAFGFLGVFVLMGGDILKGLNASALAQASVLIATLSYGFAGVYGKKFKSVNPILVATGQLTASSIMMAIILIFAGEIHNLIWPSQLAIWSVIGLAIPCTAIAYLLFFSILARAGATNVSLVTFLVPVSAIVLGIVFLDESLTLLHLAGMSAITIGLIILDGRIFGKN